MKTLVLTLFTLLSCNVFLMSKSNTEITVQQLITLDQIEEPSNDEHEGRECHSGGRGAVSCDINAGIKFDIGLSGGCSVTCGSGYYACCNFYCECKEI